MRREPVKLTRRTAGCEMSVSTTLPASAGALVTTLTTPSGMPASRNAVPISRCVAGQSSDALRTTVLPQASGIAIARTPSSTGAFHGAMPSTTPAGWRKVIARRRRSVGITSPVIGRLPGASRNRVLADVEPYQAVAPISRSSPRRNPQHAKRSHQCGEKLCALLARPERGPCGNARDGLPQP
jgi:hypothetical protein